MIVVSDLFFESHIRVMERHLVFDSLVKCSVHLILVLLQFIVLLFQSLDVGCIVSYCIDDKIFSLISPDFFQKLDLLLVLTEHCLLLDVLFPELI